MAILFLASPTASSLSRTCAPIITSRPLSRHCSNSTFGLYAISYVGCRIHAPFIPNQRGDLIAKASSDVEGSPSDSLVPSSESEEENVAIENLPLDSKLQLKLEQKTRMKLAKKIRLRRKRLVRKRHLRKKGRWPPSKMKKNKNV